MNEINEMNEIVIADMRDENGELMKFRTKEHAKAYLKKQDFSDEEILEKSFIYTNESRECECFLCEKRHTCYISDRFQRLPRDKGGIGLCLKLNG